MTLLEVKNQLISFFFSHDSFEFKRHQLEVTFDKDSADFREPLLREALADLERIGIVKKMVVAGDEVAEARESWMLTQPVFSFSQNLVVGALTAEIIANTINGASEDLGVKLSCDKTKLGEQDLLKLCGIIDEMAERLDVLTEEEDDK